MELLSDAVFVSWLALVAQLLLALFIWRRYFSPLSDIPGPFLASFSRFWHIRHIFIGDQNVQFINMHEKHGHFLRIAQNEVSISHPDGIKKVLLQQLHKGHWYTSLRLPDWRYTQPMSIVDPKQKIERSKSFNPAFNITNLLQQEDAINETVDLLLGWLDKHAESGEPINLDKLFTFTTFDLVGELMFSQKFGFLETGTDVGNAIKNNSDLNLLVAVLGFFTPWYRILMNPLTTELGLLPMGHLFHRTMTALDKREKNPDARNDIAGHWLRVSRDHPERLSLRDVHAQVNSNVGAGADTVSCGLQSFVYHTGRHPAILARVRGEIQAAVAQGYCQDRVVSFTDAQKLPYFQACIKESLRIFGPVTMGLPRVAPKGGITIGNRTFPEGTILSVNPWVMHYSKELWGPDAHEFNPDRWLAADASLLKKYWIPFGAGYSSCPGHNVAKMEISKICATLLRDYNIRQVDPSQNWTYHAYFIAVPHSWPCYIDKKK